MYECYVCMYTPPPRAGSKHAGSGASSRPSPPGGRGTRPRRQRSPMNKTYKQTNDDNDKDASDRRALQRGAATGERRASVGTLWAGQRVGHAPE